MFFISPVSSSVSIVLAATIIIIAKRYSKTSSLKVEVVTNQLKSYIVFFKGWSGDFINNWILTTNHRRIAVLYFIFVLFSGIAGLVLATIIRIELAYPGAAVLNNNSEKYLSVVSVHGIVMIFFMIIPLIFGAFGNFLLPTQLGIRDVAFPRLNSFIFWLTPAGFVTLMHIILFDKTYDLVSWVNYDDVRGILSKSVYEPKLYASSSYLRLGSDLKLLGDRSRDMKFGPRFLIMKIYLTESLARQQWLSYLLSLNPLRRSLNHPSNRYLTEEDKVVIREYHTSSDAEHLIKVYND